MIGELAILNVGDGDTTLTFDPNNEAETQRARSIVTDLLKRGTAIMVEVGRNEKGPMYQRVHDFDEKTGEYIIYELPEDFDITIKKEGNTDGDAPPSTRPARSRKSAAKPKRVPAEGNKAVAVGRTAGG